MIGNGLESGYIAPFLASDGAVSEITARNQHAKNAVEDKSNA
jgi:hypothetical protein